MPSTIPQPTPLRASERLLEPIFAQVAASAQNLRVDSLGPWSAEGVEYSLPRIVFRGAQESGEPYIRLAIFAGIHGDEPAGVEAIADFLALLEENPFLFRAYRIHIYPMCNPTGFDDCTRHARCGKDLNREFWCGSAEPEVQLLERELLEGRFDGLISLHSDDTSEGVYGFVRGHTLTQHLLTPALAAADAALPVNRANTIDGFHAVDGMIHTCYEGVLSAPPHQSPAPFEIILETPTHAPMDLQRKAFVLSMTEIIREYRRLISFAANI
ncbi:MAG: hypothetical protein ACO1QR_14475 [Chthoniobacteraceae bacterium]